MSQSNNTLQRYQNSSLNHNNNTHLGHLPSLFFVAEPTSKVSSLSATFPWMGSYFSLAQRQELELQALIYRYMLAGAAIPSELLQPIKKGLLHSPPYFLHHYSHYQQPPCGYWGRAAMDPEPGRCRRTDGKKWRCSRDVVAGHKYCKRHMHRGRNRSRKPVEIPTPTPTTNTTSTTTSPVIRVGDGDGGGAVRTLKTTGVPAAAVASPLALVGPSVDLLPFNQIQSSSTCKTDPPNEINNNNNRSEVHILRHFFDDWPRSLDESEPNNGPSNASTCLSISMPGNAASDVSLKLSTGPGGNGDQDHAAGPHQTHLNWATAWPPNQVASMGGPLAEALRSSTSNSSPTSVLNHLPRNSASETGYVST